MRVQVSLPAVIAVLLAACGPAKVEPSLVITAAPRTLDATNQMSTIRVTATDDENKPGSGIVDFTVSAGALSDNDTALTAGEGSVIFTCPTTMAGCAGSVRITATWHAKSGDVTANTSVTVLVPVMDAGVDAGTRLDGGVFDGGMAGDFALSLTTAKTNLIASGSDSSDVVVRLFTNTVGMLPVADTVNLTLTGGASFSASGAMASTTVTTSASSGAATITVYPGTAVGDFQLIATARDAAQSLTMRALNVQSIAFKDDSMTLRTLNVVSTGVNTTSQIFFEVRDTSNNPLEGVTVQFAVASGSAAGCSVAPTTAVSNMMGIVRTTLTSGDSGGSATVKATVMGLPEASSPAINIVIGRPSDGRLQVSCVRKTLGAYQTVQPPRIDQNTICTASFADRNGVKPGFAVQVSWLNEAGQVDTVSTGMAGMGLATTNFNTSGNLPVATAPMMGEPSVGTNNPRDAFVTVIAALSGEEQFWDGSGSSNNVTNGRWDPGEWFVDLPEPFVDANDNGVFDPGEPFIDTDRIDCATGMNLGKNQNWDGPNGCWDKNTQIWAPTHIVYSGNLIGGLQNTPYVSVQPPFPSFVPVMATSIHNVGLSDVNLNRLSSDGITASLVAVSGTRGTATISNPPSGGESFGGHSIDYPLIRATETAPGMFREDGVCDSTIPDAGYPATRCFKVVRFVAWDRFPTGLQVTITGASPQSALPDGGVAPPTTSNFDLRVGNSLQASPSSVPFTVVFE